MKAYRLFVFDLDGTLYRGSEPMPYAADVLAAIRQTGAAVRFYTNYSGATRDQVAEKLRSLGIEAHPEEVLTSGIVAVRYLMREGWERVFAVGEPGLVRTLAEHGLDVIESAGEPADAVVAGICRSFTYDLMARAMERVRAGAAFVATNADPTYPLEEGRLQPGAGAIVRALEVCSERPAIVVGKPSALGFEMALLETGASPPETMVVGDRPETDLAGAAALGCASWLVLTGVTSQLPDGQPGSPDLRGLWEYLAGR